MRERQLEIIRGYLMEVGTVDKNVEQLSDTVVQLLACFIIKERRITDFVENHLK